MDFWQISQSIKGTAIPRIEQTFLPRKDCICMAENTKQERQEKERRANGSESLAKKKRNDRLVISWQMATEDKVAGTVTESKEGLCR